MPQREKSWNVQLRVDDVTEAGSHFAIAADPATRAAIAQTAGLLDLSRLEAQFDVRRQGRNGLRVEGAVSATVTQTCVVSLDPLVNEIDEIVDVAFSTRATEPEGVEPEGGGSTLEAPDPPELLVGGVVDLGALAVEFLLLGLDPYPRKPDAVLAAPAAGETGTSAFAALAALKATADAKE